MGHRRDSGSNCQCRSFQGPRQNSWVRIRVPLLCFEVFPGFSAVLEACAIRPAGPSALFCVWEPGKTRGKQRLRPVAYPRILPGTLKKRRKEVLSITHGPHRPFQSCLLRGRSHSGGNGPPPIASCPDFAGGLTSLYRTSGLSTLSRSTMAKHRPATVVTARVMRAASFTGESPGWRENAPGAMSAGGFAVPAALAAAGPLSVAGSLLCQVGLAEQRPLLGG